MPSRRRRVPIAQRRPQEVNSAQAKFELFTYTLSRLPPRQLPFLAVYAAVIVYATSRGWIPKGSIGKAGASIVGVLSMVTGLLLSYRFSSAVQKWDEGKKVWVDVRTNIRDGMRLLAVPPQMSGRASSPAASSPVDLGEDDLSSNAGSEEAEMPEPTAKVASKPPTRSSTNQTLPVRLETSRLSASPEKRPTSSSGSPSPSWRKDDDGCNVVLQRTDELGGLFVGFAFALQHHLHNTRPLPQAPLVDLLPSAYLSSLKRTESRVRFADSHAGPSGSTSILGLSSMNASADTNLDDGSRPGLRRRGTGPPSKEEREAAGDGAEEWELSSLRDKAEEAVAKLADALAGTGAEDDLELKKQLNQLNIPPLHDDGRSATNLSPSGTNGVALPTQGTASGLAGCGTSSGGSSKPKSNLYSPHPPNLPLALLKLMEAYVTGLAEMPIERGGWPEAKRERALAVVKALGAALANAERLASSESSGLIIGPIVESVALISSDPPPLPLTLHLTHLLNIYLAALPCSLLCVVSSWALVLITVVAGWCLLGLEALITEVGGVFGQSENHQPLPLFTNQVLMESVDISPAFAKYYRSRLITRVGEEDKEVADLDRRTRRNEGEWLPDFA